MNAIAAQFQEVFQLYLALAEKLTQIMNVEDWKNPKAYVQSILQNRDCLTRIEQLNSRMLELSREWEQCRAHLDRASLEEVRSLVEATRAQAVRLRELCGLHAQKLQEVRDKLGRNLLEIAKGARFLKSIKPIKNNYPKFVDSSY